MSKILKFDVTLDSPTGIYHPGDPLSGSITLKIRDDIPCYGVYLWVLGQADVSWADKPGSHKTNFEYEIYMKDCITLWGREPGQRRPGENLVLTAGVHEYNFQFRLPDDLSSSFESQDVCKGRVHYLLRARLDSPDEHVRQTRDRTLIILSTLDLNKEHRVAESAQIRRDKYICCCCCKSGPISCALRLDRTGYVPGEDINLDAEIQNFSRKDITHSYVTMQQHVHFHAAGVSKTCTSDIFRISGGKIKPGDNALFHDIIHIPPLPPSRLDGCNLIDIDYVITVGVMPAGVSNPIEVTVPIIIGTVPLAVILPPGMLAKVTPSFSRYSHSSGEIEDYDASDYQRGKEPHGVALFGTGRIGRVHLQDILKNRHLRLIYLVEADIKFAEVVHSDFRLGPDVKILDIKDADMVYSDTRVKCILVCTPSKTHEVIVRGGLNAGKAVFCEKPLALTNSAVAECCKISEEKGLVLFCAFNRRFDPQVREIYNRVRKGEIGKLRVAKTTSRDPPGMVSIEYIKISGGIFTDSAVHDIDLLCWMVGEFPSRVYATGYATDPAFAECGDVDTCYVTLAFPGGTIGNFEVSRNAQVGYDQRTEVFGTKGMLLSDNRKTNAVILNNSEGTFQAPVVEELLDRYSDSYRLELEHFVDLLDGKVKAEVTGTSMHCVNIIADACKRSLHTGQCIELNYDATTI